jgi:hypothetical protein
VCISSVARLLLLVYRRGGCAGDLHVDDAAAAAADARTAALHP